MMFSTTPRTTHYNLRGAVRSGRMFIMLDAAGVDDLSGQLIRAGMMFETLFDGEDALFLSGEAPYLVQVTAKDALAIKRVIQSTRQRHAGFAMLSNVSIDTLRRHWKTWLTANINEGVDMALFRFYDARILVAFLGTLSSTELAAFTGPTERLIVAQANEVVDIRTLPIAPESVLPDVSAGTSIYQIDSHQMDVFSAVTDGVFRERLDAYLRQVFWETAESMPTDDMAALIDASIADCGRLGVCREGDVVVMAVARVLRPDLVADDAYWAAILEQRPNPNQRAGAFLSEMAFDMPRREQEIFYAKVNYWWDFGKDAD